MTYTPKVLWTSIATVTVFSFVVAFSREIRADEAPKFYRAINLGGPALAIDDTKWEADDARGVECRGSSFENQTVRLLPSTDRERAQMIRSSRWSPQGKARIALNDVPAGAYSVYLYVWEDNDAQTFDIRLNGNMVAERVNSGRAGSWQRLGPWVIDVAQGKIELAVDGGHANLSGLEIWSGKLVAEDHPLPDYNLTASKGDSLDQQAAVILARNCMECHNASDRKGELDLSQRERALAGSESGVILTPGKADESTLLERIIDGEMPPENRPKLTEAEQQLIRRWINAGAKWAADPIDPFLYTSDRRAGYNWWSLQPISAVQPPDVKDNTWPRNAIDRFVLQRLEQADLSPTPEADRQTLIRRLYFDLIGLPPTPEEVELFVNDNDPRAYERLVDRLLDSPNFGERWARHWLDIVRYGESQGFERNKFRESAWKYRDFVVEAFNSDMPYDQFIRWQIAGDVLAPDDPLAVIGSGFLALGPYDLTAYNNGTADMRAFAREEELEGLVATVGQTFMGLTINCARCHDHKFDPITQKEFYRFSAALGGTYQGDEREGRTREGQKLAEERIAKLRREIEAIAEDESASESARRDLAAKRSRAESVIRLLNGGPVHTTRPQQPGSWHILARGDYRQPGEIVAPGGIAAVSSVSSDWQLEENAPEAERRKALANWLADPNNPLTPRVIVNRLWEHHFGQGLVHTPSDFGFQGGVPSHPELLDWLARQLVHPDEGPAWSLKRIHRLIVTSAAYRQAGSWNTKGSEIDADNRLLWRRTPQRLEAEIFRDAVLSASGEIDLRIGGPGYRDYKVSSAGNNETYTVFEAVGDEFNRRTLYRTWVRTGTSPLLDMLDCPDPSVATPDRSVTSTPLQALSLLNSKFMEHYARKFAERVEREAASDPAAQASRTIALAFSRPASREEIEFGQQQIAEHGLMHFCLVLMNANEFLYVD